MTSDEYTDIRLQAEVLKELLPVYSGKTIDNIFTQLQARLKEAAVESDSPLKEST